MFIFEILPNKNLKISLGNESAENVKSYLEDHTSFETLLEFTESYWTNGWGVTTGDLLGQLTECPIIAEDLTIEDDGSNTLNGKAWYFGNYMVENEIETILENGFIEFTFWSDFDNDNFKNPFLVD